MIFLLSLVLCIALVIVFGQLFFAFCEWAEVREKTDPHIKFKSFIRFYNLNPNRWNLLKYGVSCKTDLSDRYGKYVNFSFIDFLRYRRWCRKNEANEEKKQANETLVDIINAVKQDIKRYGGDTNAQL